MSKIEFGNGVMVDCPNLGRLTWDDYFLKTRETGMSCDAFEYRFYKFYPEVVDYVDRGGVRVLYIPNEYSGVSKHKMLYKFNRGESILARMKG